MQQQDKYYSEMAKNRTETWLWTMLRLNSIGCYEKYPALILGMDLVEMGFFEAFKYVLRVNCELFCL